MTKALITPTLAQLRGRTRRFIDEPVQANYSDADINFALNTAQQEVATEISLVDEKYFVNTTPTTITSVVDQQFYDLATDFWKMTRFQDGLTGIMLKFGDFSSDGDEGYGSIPSLVDSNQMAYKVAIVGNSLSMLPVPTTAGITSKYWYVPLLKSMVDDTDTSDIPINFVDLLCIQAAIDMLISDEDDSSALERRYNRRFNQLVRATRDRQQQDPKHVSRVASNNNIYGGL